MSQSVSGTHPYDLLPYTENDTEVYVMSCIRLYITVIYRLNRPAKLNGTPTPLPS